MSKPTIAKLLSVGKIPWGSDSGHGGGPMALFTIVENPFSPAQRTAISWSRRQA